MKRSEPLRNDETYVSCVTVGVLLAVAMSSSSVGPISGTYVDPGPLGDILNRKLAATFLDEELYVIEPILLGNVTVWPVYSTAKQKSEVEFTTLSEAQQNMLAVIREADMNADGQVNEVIIQNHGLQPIMALAGSLLQGGKQDRQIAQTSVIPSGSEVSVDVFSVDENRYADRQGKGFSSNYLRATGFLAPRKLRARAQFEFNNTGTVYQQDVWRRVRETSGNTDGLGTTNLIRAISAKGGASKVLRRRIENKLQDLIGEWLGSELPPVGFAYAINGAVQEIRAFANPRIFRSFADILSRSVAIEGELAYRKSPQPQQWAQTQSTDNRDVQALVNEVSGLKEQAFGNRAGGKNAFILNNNILQTKTKYKTKKGKVYVPSRTWVVAE